LKEHHIQVTRTARYATLGPDDGSARDLWFVLHGQGQLAARFIRHFEPLDDGTRLIVAPEALSRYYVDHPSAAPGEPPRVGASWMTRDDREAEINDYVSFLDALPARVCAAVPRESSRLTVLGFSQGAATATRWASLGTPRADRVLCWGGAVAHDVALGAGAAGLRGARLTLVAGTRDEYATPAVIAAEEARLRAAGVGYELRTFSGGHRIQSATLAAVAAE
jgi:predicted esterase